MSADEWLPSLGTVIAGRYELQELLGRGSLGGVFRAVHHDIGRDVAVKVLHRMHSADPAIRERFRREALAANKIQHRGVVQIMDVGETNDPWVYLVLELLSGKPFERMVRERSDLSFSTVVEHLRDALEALGAAHRAGIVHRDLKPANIFALCKGDEWVGSKLLDFGIARVDDQKQITAVGDVLGTIEYMAPEQVGGQRADDACDIYSVGAILYELLAGFPPHTTRDQSRMELAFSRFSRPARPLSEINLMVPEALGHFVGRLLSNSSAGRPTTMQEVVWELERLQQQHLLDVPIRTDLGLLPPKLEGAAFSASTQVDPALGSVKAELRGEVALSRRTAIGLGPRAGTVVPFSAEPIPPAPSIFGSHEDRVEELGRQVRFYMDHAHNEYAQVERHVEMMHRLWILMAMVGLLILLGASVAVMFGRLEMAIAAAVVELYIGYLVRVFQKREDHYRELTERKNKQLESGRKWLLAVQTLDCMSRGPELDKQMSNLAAMVMKNAAAPTPA